jgi:hypothetical protein
MNREQKMAINIQEKQLAFQLCDLGCISVKALTGIVMDGVTADKGGPRSIEDKQLIIQLLARGAIKPKDVRVLFGFSESDAPRKKAKKKH